MLNVFVHGSAVRRLCSGLVTVPLCIFVWEGMLILLLEAKLAAVLELRHEFSKCLDLDNTVFPEEEMYIEICRP